MPKIQAAITGVQGYVPEDILTNKDLEKMVDTNDEWITSRTGIKTRHILKGENQGTSVMAIKAVEGLDIDVVIAAGSPWSKYKDSTSEYPIPENVTVKKFSQYELRQLYANSTLMVMPLVEGFAPDWLIISAGFDGHRDDPLAGLRLTSGDYADLAVRLQQLVPARRVLVVLEGGYDLQALTYSVGSTLSALLGESYRPEDASTGEIGMPTVVAAKQVWELT